MHYKNRVVKIIIIKQNFEYVLHSSRYEHNGSRPHEETLGPQLPIERTVKTDRTGQMRMLIRVFAWHTKHIVGFVVLRLK